MRNNARGISIDRAYEVGTVIDVIIHETDRKKLLLYLLPGYAKKLQKRNLTVWILKIDE